MEINNETVGISAEIAIADIFQVKVKPHYRQRGNETIIKSLIPTITNAFQFYNIPNPVYHIAEQQNSVDFELKNGYTLSVKTNQKDRNKVAPQKVGQPTSSTYFDLFSDFYNLPIPVSLSEKQQLYKKTCIEYIEQLLPIYYKHLFHCDYTIYIFNILTNSNELTYSPMIKVYPLLSGACFDRNRISFTQDDLNWNNKRSTTVKYDGISIGEFQLHQGRDTFKFRFIMKGVDYLIDTL
ncbi:MAG: hypothetical protein BEN18_11170 [Epulopiscium sp. Nuni2H_MBin001]|nr:MAG: hypothetical protein BEN18_11170 [Epulopiscium sp. Nuni2H_MBin001]